MTRSDLREMLRPVRNLTRLAVGIQIAGAVAEIVPFVAIVEVARELLAADPDETRLRYIAVVVVAALGVRALCAASATTLTHFADVRMQAVLRRRIVGRLRGVPLSWFDRRSSGELKKATDEDISALHYLVAHSAVETTAGIAVPVIGFAYLASVDWRLALVALLPIPLYGGALAVMMRDGSEMMNRMNEGTARVNSAVVEYVRGIAVVKTFGRAGEAHAAYRTATDDFARFFAGWVRPMLRLDAIASMALVPTTVLAINVGFGLWFRALGWVDVVDVLTASMIGMVIPAAVHTLSRGMTARMEARAAAERLWILTELPQLPQPVHPERPRDATVELDRVSVRYDDGTVGLDDVSLCMPPGTVTAIVGPSGAGKSTLASTVLRFRDVDTGSVSIGGVDVRRIESRELYARIGFILQDVQLLRASIADNIALAKPQADRSEVERVARAAQIHDRICALPRGYDSVVGDDARLSGGEAQRVSIARAMLHDPDVLVLDEATAFADPDVEAAVQRALSELAHGRTLLVVAHRLETIVDADQIAVLDRGRLVEVGRHRDLVASGGTYADMWSVLREVRA